MFETLFHIAIFPSFPWIITGNCEFVQYACDCKLENSIGNSRSSSSEGAFSHNENAYNFRCRFGGFWFSLKLFTSIEILQRRTLHFLFVFFFRLSQLRRLHRKTLFRTSHYRRVLRMKTAFRRKLLRLIAGKTPQARLPLWSRLVSYMMFKMLYYVVNKKK